MTENNYNKLIDAICELVNLAWDSTSKEEFERLDNAGADIIDCLEKLQQFEAIEIPESQGDEIVAGIMLPKVKGKAVVSLSDLHDILMDVGGINIRDKVFEQIYDRGVIIGLRDVIEKWEERRKNAEHEDCALSCEEIRNKAIDEFAEMLKDKYSEHKVDNYLRVDDYYSYSDSCKVLENYIDEIKQEMKAGGENE